MTLHSWGAIAPTVDNVDKLIKCIRTARPAMLRWKTTEILIIDEGMLFTERVKGRSLSWKQCQWLMATCSRELPPLPLNSGRRQTGHLEASRLARFPQERLAIVTVACSLLSLATSSSYPL
jgi:hypothetical protein